MKYRKINININKYIPEEGDLMDLEELIKAMEYE